MSWREEMRADRAALAEQKRADQRLAYEQRRADLAAQVEQDRHERQERRAERERRATARRARLQQATGWCRAHVLDVLFVPVIVVPALLAWTAMADYGHALYGPVGWLLPVFSEGAMWVFAAATTITRRRDPQRPVAVLQAGTWLFATVGAALNFAHGLPSGVDVGAVMSLVSIAGVLAHQVITASPRRTRDQRAETRLARRVARREHAVRAAAVRHAVAELAADGTARLIYRPGTVTLTRRVGRPARLVEAMVPGREPAPLSETETPGGALAEEITDWLAIHDGTTTKDPAGTAQTPKPGTGSRTPADRVPALLARVRAAIADGRLPAEPSRREVQRFLRVRAALATAVTRALKSDGPGGVPART